MNDTNPLANEIAQLLGDILCERIDPTALEAKLIQDYGANSMDVVDIVERIERRFAITIPNSDVGTLVTFGDVVTYVMRCRQTS